jgi:hypothetical protein
LQGSEEGEDSLPANAEPEVKLRHSITQLDSDLLDSWDFDVFFFTPDQLIAYVALMFMHLGLTTQDVRRIPLTSLLYTLCFVCGSFPFVWKIPQ